MEKVNLINKIFSSFCKIFNQILLNKVLILFLLKQIWTKVEQFLLLKFSK